MVFKVGTAFMSFCYSFGATRNMSICQKEKNDPFFFRMKFWTKKPYIFIASHVNCQSNGAGGGILKRSKKRWVEIRRTIVSFFSHFFLWNSGKRTFFSTQRRDLKTIMWSGCFLWKSYYQSYSFHSSLYFGFGCRGNENLQLYRRLYEIQFLTNQKNDSGNCSSWLWHWLWPELSFHNLPLSIANSVILNGI